MRRDRHDGAASIGCQDIVSNIDFYFSSVDRIDGIRSEEDARLLLGAVRSFQVGLAGNFLKIFFDILFLFIGSQFSDQRMFRSQNNIGTAK